MNQKQKCFVQEYLKDANAAQAAERAGYSAKTAKMQGSRLMTYDDVQAAVTVGQVAIAEQAEVTQDWLVEEFKENHKLAREGNPVIDRYGKPTGGVMRQIGASNKALEAIAVLTGFWVQKTKETFDGKLTIQVVRFGDDGVLDITPKTPPPLP